MTPAFAAEALRAARATRSPRKPFTDDDATLDEQWGYRVQDEDRAQRLARGERIVGAKLGLTSRAKQVTMDVHQPIVGFLSDAMHVADSDDVFARTAQPRIEPEIAFRLGRVLDRPLTMADAADAIDGVAVAMESIDSRYAGFGFRLPDVVADNTSAAAFVVGDWVDPATAGGLAAVRCVFSGDGSELHSATGAAVLGHPLRALLHLSEHLVQRGEHLPAGAIVLAGALTDAVPIRPGVEYRADIDHLGTVCFSTPHRQGQ